MSCFVVVSEKRWGLLRNEGWEILSGCSFLELKYISIHLVNYFMNMFSLLKMLVILRTLFFSFEKGRNFFTYFISIHSFLFIVILFQYNFNSLFIFWYLGIMVMSWKIFFPLKAIDKVEKAGLEQGILHLFLSFNMWCHEYNKCFWLTQTSDPVPRSY